MLHLPHFSVHQYVDAVQKGKLVFNHPAFKILALILASVSAITVGIDMRIVKEDIPGELAGEIVAFLLMTILFDIAKIYYTIKDVFIFGLVTGIMALVTVSIAISKIEKLRESHPELVIRETAEIGRVSTICAILLLIIYHWPSFKYIFSADFVQEMNFILKSDWRKAEPIIL